MPSHIASQPARARQPEMDKYHIYDEIGKGEFSQVFKGREKKKISYVAIKRVDKGVMSKVSSSN